MVTVKECCISIILLLALSVFSYGQEVGKTISYGEEFTLISIMESENFLASRIMNKQTRDYTVTLYDTEGNVILEMNDFRNSVKEVFPIDDLRLLIVVVSGNSAHPGIPENPDRIMAIEIDSGDLLWEAYSNADEYILSPDESKLATSGFASDRKSQLQIIDLVNGSDLMSTTEFGYYRAEWLDNDRLIILTQPKGLVASYEIEKQKFDEVLEERNVLNENYINLKTMRTNGTIDEEQFKAEAKILNERKKVLIELSRTMSKSLTSKSYTQRWEKKSAQISIYDVRNAIIEYSTYLISSTGTPLNVSIQFNEKFNMINIDEREKIIVYAYTVEDGFGFGQLVLLNRELDVINNIQLGKIGEFQVSKIRNGDKLYWRIYRKGSEKQFYDELDGEPITIEELLNSTNNENYNKEVFNDMSRRDIQLSKKYQADYSNNTINFSRSGGEK